MPKRKTQKQRATTGEPESLGQLGASFWTVREVAAYCRCSNGAVWGWKRAGVLRAYGQGRVVRFKAADVEALMAQPK